jgi:hypothetical protein
MHGVLWRSFKISPHARALYGMSSRQQRAYDPCSQCVLDAVDADPSLGQVYLHVQVRTV